jgi:hypothetical protein
MSDRVHHRALASNFALGIGDDTPGVAHRPLGADIPARGRSLGLTGVLSDMGSKTIGGS